MVYFKKKRPILSTKLYNERNERGESDGNPYKFVSKPEFEKMIEKVNLSKK
jgi:guanylate kinase